MPIVAKPFNTTQRRFRLGAAVSETDDLSPLSFADLAARGFIAVDDAAPPLEAAAACEPAGEGD